MSSVVWDGDNLIQQVGDNVEALGHVKYDENSNTYILWLKDTRDVFGTNTGYIRGDSFPSMKDAKQHAALSTSARLFHYMWMVGLRNAGHAATDKAVAQGIEDAERGEPLTDSTFHEETGKTRNLTIWLFVGSVGVGLIFYFDIIPLFYAYIAEAIR